MKFYFFLAPTSQINQKYGILFALGVTTKEEDNGQANTNTNPDTKANHGTGLAAIDRNAFIAHFRIGAVH